MKQDGENIKTEYTISSPHFSMTSPAYRIINLMREMKINQRIALEELHLMFKEESKIYRGRPEMVVMRMQNGRNLQLFRGGKVQILGRITDEDAESMREEILRRLKRLKKMENCQATMLTIVNLVTSLQLPSNINFKNICHSNHDLFYEVELFPAALLRKWSPAHVAVFHNGKMIVTGVSNLNVVNDIFYEVCKFFSENHLM